MGLILFILFVAFGDSITVGGLSGREEKSYIKLLEQDFGTIDNQAVNGSSIASQVYQMDIYTKTAYTYFWMPGFNDMRQGVITVEEYKYWLRRGLDIAASREVTVYLGACLPMTAEGYNLRGGSSERWEAFNKATMQIAAEYPNVILVQFPEYDPAIHTRTDLMHPNDAGHRVIYEAFMARNRRVYLPLIKKAPG